MKTELLEKIICPKCRLGPLMIKSAIEGEYATGKNEIREGSVICNACGNESKIENGILELFYNTHYIIKKEQKNIYEADKDINAEGIGFDVTYENIKKYRKQFIALPEGDGTELFQKGAFYSCSAISEQYYAFLNNLDLTGKEELLELGADTCWNTEKFARKGCRCIALDINHHLIVAELYMGEYNIFFERVKADMAHLHFKDDSFDIVFCSQSAHHSRDIKQTMKEIQRVLKPGGKVILFSEPAPGVLFFWKKLFYGIKAKKLGLVENEYTFPTWLKLLRDVKLEPEVYFSFYPRKSIFKKMAFIFGNSVVKYLLLKSYVYPVLFMIPYKVDIIAHKKPTKAAKKWYKNPHII